MSRRLFSEALFAVAAIATARAASPVVPSFDEDKARNVLSQSLSRRDPDKRIEAVEALAILDPREPFAKRLEAMLMDRDVKVRLTAVASLSAMDSDSVVPALRKALGDKTPEVRFAAARALRRWNDPLGREALLAGIAHADQTESNVLARQGRDAVRLLHTPKPLMIMALNAGIGFAGVPGLAWGATMAESLIEDSRVSGRATGVMEVAQDTDPRIVAALKRALTDKDSTVRIAAVRAIALRNDPKAVADILPLLTDRSDVVRINANAACLHLHWMAAEAAERAE